MSEYDYTLMFIVLFAIAIPTTFGGLWSFGRIFEILKDENNEAWNELGKPAFNLDAILNQEARFPKNIILMQYKWFFSNPEWVKGNDKLKNAFRVFRLFGVISIIPAVGLTFLTLNIAIINY